MPIKSKREITCQRCGKIFNIECEDNITFRNLKKLSNKFCFKCKVLNIFRIGAKMI